MFRRLCLQSCLLTYFNQDIVLDSQAVRRTEWPNLNVADPRNFALPADAASSEAPLPVICRGRDDGVMYCGFHTACDYLRDRFKYLSMKDQSRLNVKRVT
jgi:hypothetical protein